MLRNKGIIKNIFTIVSFLSIGTPPSKMKTGLIL